MSTSFGCIGLGNLSRHLAANLLGASFAEVLEG